VSNGLVSSLFFIVVSSDYLNARASEGFKRVYVLEVDGAEVEDRVQPSVSHVVEMLSRKGVKAYRNGRK